MRQSLILRSLLCLAAAIGSCEAKCKNNDSCANAVRGTLEGDTYAADVDQRRAECQSFLAVQNVMVTNTITAYKTVAPKAQTEEEEDLTIATTVDVTKQILKTKTVAPVEKRSIDDDDVSPSATTDIPDYARSHCSKPSQYASACSCWGSANPTVITTKATITVTATSTKTVQTKKKKRPTVTEEITVEITKTSTVTKAAPTTKVVRKCTSPTENLCGSTCKDIFTDGGNCGACGVKCKKDAVCINGVCSEPACKGVAAWECDAKSRRGCNGQPDDDCFCMHTKGGVGFCTTFSTLPIYPEAQWCTSHEDCPFRQVCGSIACYGKRRICVEPHGLQSSCGNSGAPSRLFRGKWRAKRTDPDAPEEKIET
ncbi:hypothetical protein DRE_03781 [Drechslerella stenobrocha 248]|uniref:Uncharacterized protein n=1 Tax=Drechslerella stenobrocha 248 TaxID=1043628 RepID=W7HU90_9PEZI|nr:hypothetical protein DRE_03781 [Drechslerella stenobrocha 248]